jgi:hypothetical protein
MRSWSYPVKVWPTKRPQRQQRLTRGVMRRHAAPGRWRAGQRYGVMLPALDKTAKFGLRYPMRTPTDFHGSQAAVSDRSPER